MKNGNIGVGGVPKPIFEEGERVSFSYDGKVRGTGRIRGKATEHVFDMWIVQVDTSEDFDKDIYPWSCIVVPHTLLQLIEPKPESKKSKARADLMRSLACLYLEVPESVANHVRESVVAYIEAED